MPNLHDVLSGVPAGRRRVAQVLIGGRRARTYTEVARALGVHLGTVYEHLRRLRLRHAEVYAAVMAVRGEQLAERHARAVERAAAHSRAWFRRKAARTYYYRYGRWPWERRGKVESRSRGAAPHLVRPVRAGGA